MKKTKRQIKAHWICQVLPSKARCFCQTSWKKPPWASQAQSRVDYPRQRPALKDDYSRAFQCLCPMRPALLTALEREDIDALTVARPLIRRASPRCRPATAVCQSGGTCSWHEWNGRSCPIAFVAGHVPVVVAPLTPNWTTASQTLPLEAAAARKNQRAS